MIVRRGAGAEVQAQCWHGCVVCVVGGGDRGKGRESRWMCRRVGYVRVTVLKLAGETPGDG